MICLFAHTKLTDNSNINGMFTIFPIYTYQMKHIHKVQFIIL